MTQVQLPITTVLYFVCSFKLMPVNCQPSIGLKIKSQYSTQIGSHINIVPAVSVVSYIIQMLYIVIIFSKISIDDVMHFI